MPSGWRRLVPPSARPPLRRVAARFRRRWARRPLRLGSLRRLSPFDLGWGSARGTPIDRLYIERFLERHRSDVAGHVLEVGDARYTRRFGEGVTSNDVLGAQEAHPGATVVADLANAPQLPDDAYDCVILTHVLQFVYEVDAALATLHRILAPGGVLLATVPGITRISPAEDEPFGDWWRFTARSVRRLAEEAFPGGAVDVETFGNLLAATGLLYGLAAEDLSPRELEAHDRLYEVVIGLRAAKGAATA
jgi:SAM-dependent methyltransferase